MNERMSGVFSLLCMVGFALAWWWGDIYIATGVLMALLTAQLAFLLIKRRATKSIIVLWGLVVVMGGLTLILQDKTFIQSKTTIVYAIFALTLLITDFGFGKNLPKHALSAVFDAPDAIWRRVCVAFALYFLTLSACNAVVAYYLSEGAWISIKTFGFPAATLVFTLIVAAFLFRYQKPNKP